MVYDARGEPGSLVGTEFELPRPPCATITASRPARRQAVIALSAELSNEISPACAFGVAP